LIGGAPRGSVQAGKKSLVAQAGPLFLGRGGSTLLCFALPLLLTRLLPQAEYGTYKALFLVATTAFFVLQVGLSQSLYYFVPRAGGDARAYFTQSLLGCTVAGGCGALLLHAVREPIAHQFGNPQLAAFAAPMALIAFTMVATSPLEVMLTAEGNGRCAGLAIFLSDLVRIPASVLPVLAGGGLVGLLWGNVGHGALRMLACAALLARRGARLNGKLARAHLAYALPFGAAVAIDIPQKTFHQYAVGGAVSPTLFAIYMQGCFQIPIISLLYSPISDVLQVRMAARRGGSREAIALFHEANLRLAAVFLPFTACMFAAGALFIPGLFTHQYDASVPIYRLAVLAVPFSALPLDGMLRSLDQTRYLFRIFCLKLALTVPAVLLGLHLFGMAGAIGGQVLAEWMVRGAMLDRVRRELSCGWSEILPWRALGRLAGSSLAACAPVLVIVHAASGSPRPFLPLAAAAVCYGAVYLAALAWAPGPGSPADRLKRALLGDPGAPPLAEEPRSAAAA
jgi:O-antigen/teichoic acid export membrane protein